MMYVVGIDSSTTATKAVLVDDQGTVAATATAAYDFATPHPLWSEQDPALWWEAASSVVRQVLANAGATGPEVAAVGLTGQMHGLVILDKADVVIRPAILWNDQRTSAECDEVRDRVGFDELVRITGNDCLPGFTAPKLMWVRNHEPEVFARIAHVLLPKDYVRLRLTGDHATDRAGAAGTILFDLDARNWSADLLNTLELPQSWFPKTHEGPQITGVVTAEAGAATRLAPGTPVVAGAGDQAASAFGTGVVDPGLLSVSLGTSGVVFAATDSARRDARGRVHAFCHAVADRWHLMGVMLSAGGSLRWFRDALAPGVAFETLIGEAATVRAGSDGLVFLPYLTGERTPYPDPLARGAFVGLTVGHGRAQLVRAVLEGVAFGLRDSLDLMLAAGVPQAQEVRVTGGGARSELWRQILADVLGTSVVSVEAEEGAAYGAAMLAAVGVEWADAESLARRWVRTGRPIETSADHVGYGALHEEYRKLYPALRPTFHALSARREPSD